MKIRSKNMSLNITQDFIPAGRRNRPGRANPMNFITIHNTGNANAGAGASNHARYIKGDHAASRPASWHYTVDERDIFQHLPDNEDAFHAGDGAGPGNRQSIGIEIAMNSDRNLLEATDKTAELTAFLCLEHDIPIENIVQHHRWSGKNCPQKIRAGRPYNWAEFISRVRNFMSASKSVSGTPQNITAEELDILERIVWAEARGEDERGQVLVVNVIMNRVNSPSFPNTIRDVVFAPGQFTPITNGAFERATPDAGIHGAVRRALAGADYSRGATFFRAIRGAEGSWHEQALQPLFDHGGHRFYTARAAGTAPSEPQALAVSAITAGSHVRLRVGAVSYDTGGAISAWVFAHAWIVERVEGDRAVIHRRADGSATGTDIRTPVHVKDLILA